MLGRNVTLHLQQTLINCHDYMAVALQVSPNGIAVCVSQMGHHSNAFKHFIIQIMHNI